MSYSLQDDPLVLADRSFRSRLIVGTGKYASFAVMKEALEKSGAEIVTVAVRRIKLQDKSTRYHEDKSESLLDYIDTSRFMLLPNTAGCHTAEEAIRVANLGREGSRGDGRGNEPRRSVGTVGLQGRPNSQEAVCYGQQPSRRHPPLSSPFHKHGNVFCHSTNRDQHL